MKLNKRQKITIVLTVMVLLLTSLSHLYIKEKLQYYIDSKKKYEKIAVIYEKEGIEGVKSEIKKMFSDEEYCSSDAFLIFAESKIKSWDDPIIELNTGIKLMREKLSDLRKWHFYINIALLATLIAGISITVMLGIKE